MLRVRFPNGLTVQYNTATLVKRDPNYGWSLYTKEGGQWVATIQGSAGAIVESVPACRVYQGCGDADGQRLESVLEDVSKIRKKITKLSTAQRKARKA